MSHGWKMCSDVEPVETMEKVLYTIDELTGLIHANALMRPTGISGMKVKSVKKSGRTNPLLQELIERLLQKGRNAWNGLKQSN